MERMIVGISGASGIVLAHHLIKELCRLNFAIDLVITPQALYTARYELGEEYTTAKRFVESFSLEEQKVIVVHSIQDIGCSIASGSYPVRGMVIVPCSMATVAAISVGLGDNCLRRAADVTLKEKRPLILVPRETPFSEIHLENLTKLARRGVTIVPPIPAWYTRPKTLADIEFFIVGKILDALKLPHTLYPHWNGAAR